MGYKVLVVDDDATFNNLLTDIFRQAGHEVYSEEDPLKALSRIDEENMDLLVTDHRMPELTGHELFKRVREQKPDIPIVIVSGYLSNSNIRALIEEGINGVYIRPLNVFALLKQAENLISQSKTGELGAHQRTLSDQQSRTPSEKLPFPFTSFPCLHQKSEAFARRLFELRNFKSTLVLIGEDGTPFTQICADLSRFDTSQKEQFVSLQAGMLTSDTLFAKLKRAQSESVTRLTFVLRDLEQLTASARDLIVSLIKSAPPYDILPGGSRVIFCTGKDVDSLYDNGLIDDRMYVLMGAGELRVPSLRAIPEDIPVMARKLVTEIATNLNMKTIPQLGVGCGKLLKTWPWKGNFEELRNTLEKIIRDHPVDTLTPALFQGQAMVSEVNVTEADLVEMLRGQKRQILQGIKMIANHRQEVIDAILGGSFASPEDRQSGTPFAEQQAS